MRPSWETPTGQVVPMGTADVLHSLVWLAAVWLLCSSVTCLLLEQLSEVQSLWLSPNNGIHRGDCEVPAIAAALAHVTTCGNEGSPGRVFYPSATQPPLAVQSVTQQKTQYIFCWVAAHSSVTKDCQFLPKKGWMSLQARELSGLPTTLEMSTLSRRDCLFLVIRYHSCAQCWHWTLSQLSKIPSFIYDKWILLIPRSWIVSHCVSDFLHSVGIDIKMLIFIFAK